MNHRPGFGAFPLSGGVPVLGFGAYMSRNVKITVTESACRSGFHAKGQTFVIDAEKTICPPMCMELWHYAFPYVWALINGAENDRPDGSRKAEATIVCPDGGRVRLHIETI